MSAASTRGAYAHPFSLVFLALSGWAAYTLFKSQIFEPLSATGKLRVISEYNNTELRYDYTEINRVDVPLRYLVATLLPGVLGIDDGQKVQLAYYLFTMLPIIAVFLVEAGRKRNGWALAVCSIWALLYQSVGRSYFVSLFPLEYMRISSKAEYWIPSTRAVNVAYAKALLPAVLLGYLFPTFAMFVPHKDAFITQGFIAFWQASPIFIFMLLIGIFAQFKLAEADEGDEAAESNANSDPETNGKSNKKTSSEPSTKSPVPADPEDVKHLKRLYITTFVLSTLVHWTLLFTLLRTQNPDITPTKTIFPKLQYFRGRATPPTLSTRLLFLFQMDFWIISFAMMAWMLLTILDVNHVLGRTLIHPLKAMALVGFNSLFFGPGAALAAVWAWREGALAAREKERSD